MNKLKISDNTIIKCPTLREAEQLVKIFDQLGFKWCNEDSYIKSSNLWDINREYTYYRPQIGSYGNIKFLGPDCNTITAEEFIKLHTMEERNITLTLEKAREFYNSSNEALKEIALQAYTEEELNTKGWQNIKTFEDACKALQLIPNSVKVDLDKLEGRYFEGETSEHLVAIYKLDIIRKALNGNWKPSLVKGKVYYPIVRFYPAGQKARTIASNNSLELGESFIADGNKYTLVTGNTGTSFCEGLAMYAGYGDIRAENGLLGCKSKEIAKHMSRYFSKEIFEATYSQYVGLYKWV